MNVLIDDSGNAQICDFGLMRIYLEEGSSGMTTTSAHTGTDRYLAYELVKEGENAIPTVASDIYATGCIGLEARHRFTTFHSLLILIHRSSSSKCHIPTAERIHCVCFAILRLVYLRLFVQTIYRPTCILRGISLRSAGLLALAQGHKRRCCSRT
jgi:serine/threonine protein kinase